MSDRGATTAFDVHQHLWPEPLAHPMRAMHDMHEGHGAREEARAEWIYFSGSEHTQFSPSSLQRRSAAYEYELNIDPATRATRHAIVILAESITTYLL